MSKPKAPVDKARMVLQSAWEEIAHIPPADLEETDFVEDPEVRRIINELMNARTKAFRYAALNQILAKSTEHDINCFALQAGADLKGAFDARSLCKQVVAPFDREHFKGALGASTDPYVSKPLRRAKISLAPNVIRQIKYREEWKKLHSLLSAVEERNDLEFTQRVLKQILLEIRKLASQQSPSLPERVSAEQVRLILAEYLSLSTLGLGPQAVAYSLLEVSNKRTRTYQEVTSASPTAADTPAGRVADIECKDEKGALRLAVYVTQRLDLQKLEYELRKCKGSGVANALFLASEIAVGRREAYEEASRYGINAAIYDLVDFVLTITVLLNSEMRRELIEQITIVLQNWGGAGAVREFNEVVTRTLQEMQ
jgi:hypothetical protein